MSMTTTSQIQKKRPDVFVPDDVIQDMGDSLECLKLPEDMDARLKLQIPYVWYVVRMALRHPEQKGLVATNEEFEENVQLQGEGSFYDQLRDVARRKDWRSLLRNDVFYSRASSGLATSQSAPLSDAMIDTVLRSWNSSFRGDVADVLIMTLTNYLDARRPVYARDSSVVNSSGTGKSRMVDEVAKNIITVPMCLRDEGTQGFPPSDGILRVWLSSFKDSNDQKAVAINLHSLVEALLIITCDRLAVIGSEEDDIPKLLNLSRERIHKLPSAEQDEHVALVKRRQEMLAQAFRRRMTEGQSFNVPNDYRREFFWDIVDTADKFASGREAVARTKKALPQEAQGVYSAGKDLVRFVDPAGLLDGNCSPERPLVILAFDEARILNDIPTGQGWSLFSELRRVLRQLDRFSIFPLFLSMNEEFRVFDQEVRSDPSRRVVTLNLPALHPISETSYDDLAFPAIEDTVMLDRVIEDEWITHLGRPLFGSHYDAMVNDEKKDRDLKDLMLMAKQRLLGGPSALTAVKGPGSLACLSVRFALELDVSDEYGREVTLTQIERHMRLCVAATAGFEKLITTTGSEPFLAEAARQLTADSGADPVRHLAENSNLRHVQLGPRGELVAALIVMRARDAAAGDKRWVSVDDFMRALLPVSAYEQLQRSKPRFWRSGEDKPFREAFEGYHMWFNHVIKVRDPDMINTEHLWKFITRGAMVMCVDNPRGIDFVLPICARKQKLSRRSVTAILIQVKSDKRFGRSIDEVLFDLMEPFGAGLFSDSEPGDHDDDAAGPLPVIRLVFALGSEHAGVLIPAVPERRDGGRDGSAFHDVWCAGLSPDTFRDIDSGGALASYRAVLRRCLQPREVLDLTEVEDAYWDEATATAREEQRRNMASLSWRHAQLSA